jgi:putative ABC transport system permease protein
MNREPLWRRYARFFRPDTRADIEDEMQFHLEERARELMRSGLDASAASEQARAEFGNAARAREECEAIHGADRIRARRAGRFADLGLDIRYALRSALRRPGQALLVAFTLALGLGATTAILSVVNGVLLRPLPYAEPSRLVLIHEFSPRGDNHNPVSVGNYFDWKEKSRSFATMGAHYQPYAVSLTGSGEPWRLTVLDATPSVLALLGVSTEVGRTFTEADGTDERLLVISHALWRNQFGGDSAILSRRLMLDGRPWTIVGVMPEGFGYPGASVQAWRMVGEASLNREERRSHNLVVIARLRGGVELPAARVEMDAIATQLGVQYPQVMQGWKTNVVGLHDDLVAPVRPLIVVLMAGSVLLLLVACGSAANLLLSKALSRTREMAVRGALGAGAGRIVRQLLVESLVLATTAAAAGTAVAWVALRALVGLAPGDLPRLEAIRLDPVVLATSALLAVLTTVTVGLAPAMRMTRVDLQTTLRATTARGDRHGRMRAGLVVMEVAISLVMLIGAGLLGRSFQQLSKVDYGYEPRDLLTVDLNLPQSRYAEAPAQYAFFERLQEELRALPGVRSVSGTSEPPAYDHGMSMSFSIEGKTSPNPSGRFDPVLTHMVMPGYFTTMGVPLVRGRVFDGRDRAESPRVVIVNQALARKLWGVEDPIGSRIAFRPPPEGHWLEVVGVVGDARMESSDAAPEPMLFHPWLQKSWGWLTWQTAVMRLAPGSDMSLAIAGARRVVTELDPELAIDRISTAQELYAEGQARRRLAAVLLAGFAATALLLGVIGLYGVMSTAVAERKQEIGVRMALGAGRPAVLGMVLRQAAKLIALGVAIGVVAAAGSTRVLRALLYETSPLDPVTFVSVVIVLAAAGLGAALIPARRATAIDPMTAIRQ